MNATSWRNWAPQALIINYSMILRYKLQDSDNRREINQIQSLERKMDMIQKHICGGRLNVRKRENIKGVDEQSNTAYDSMPKCHFKEKLHSLYI